VVLSDDSLLSRKSSSIYKSLRKSNPVLMGMLVKEEDSVHRKP
jgi:hypothetical protein